MELPGQKEVADSTLPLVVSLTQELETAERGHASGEGRCGWKSRSPLLRNPYVHSNKRCHINSSHAYLKPLMANSFMLMTYGVGVDNANGVMQLNSSE